MQKKILRTTALVLCFCILLLAVPNTFAKSEKRTTFKGIKLQSIFVNPGEILTNVLIFLGPHFGNQVDRTDPVPPNNNTVTSPRKITIGGGSAAVVKDD